MEQHDLGPLSPLKKKELSKPFKEKDSPKIILLTSKVNRLNTSSIKQSQSERNSNVTFNNRPLLNGLSQRRTMSLASYETEKMFSRNKCS